MIKNEEEIYLYDYLDDDANILRESILSEYIKDNTKTEDMDFVDLGFYLKNDSSTKKIEAVAYKSILEDNITLSESQIEILGILEDKNLFLSAPTSFGKTFIVLEYMIRHPELNNIVFIVPTLALMNELLKKIFDKFNNRYNICINGEEKLGKKNIFIFVPERSDYSFVKKMSTLRFDLLIIDEIYKLKPKNKRELINDDRIILMNKVYLNLISMAKKIILLGPFIKQVSFNHTKIDIVKYYTNLSPVYNYIHKCPNMNWLEYMGDDKELVYFNSPESIYISLDMIIEKFDEKQLYIDRYKSEIEHLEKIFFKDWYGIKLLKRGIGIHHGKTPLFLRKFYEDEFRNGFLKCLLCTSTLMEGVNTPTMKMLVVDDPGSVFKLNNLIGRVGRLSVSKPSSGNIYIFNEEACSKLEDKNKWESLTILCEDLSVTSDDEVLFLEKKLDNKKERDSYNERIESIVNASGKSIEEIKKLDIRLKLAFKFSSGHYKEKFQKVRKVIDCVRLSCELLGKISYKFTKDKFDEIDYPKETLPYMVFINMLISGNSYSDVIFYFESKYGHLSLKNKNRLIDKLLELRAFIKFKLIKIINYFDLFNVDYHNHFVLRQFVLNLKKYSDLKIIDKIFEDLGVEENDFGELKSLIDEDESISTSEVISILRKNTERIDSMNLSPFTRRNIKRM